MAIMHNVAENRMFMALTGASGVGKSTTLRALKDELDSARFDVIYIGMTNPSTVGFFEALLSALRVEIPYRPNRAADWLQMCCWKGSVAKSASRCCSLTRCKGFRRRCWRRFEA